MGYRCPVCGDPQADDVHLANHLAFTAMVRGGDHESWLDEHVPEWAARDDEGLAAAVTDLAESAEYPQVFEDTTGTNDHDHAGKPTGADGLPVDVQEIDSEAMDADVEEILAEAREMTEKRRGDADTGTSVAASDERDEDDGTPDSNSSAE